MLIGLLLTTIFFGRLGGRQHNSTLAGVQASSLARPCEIVLARPPSLQKKKNCPIASGGVVFYGNWTCFVHYNIGLNPYWAA